MVVVDQGNDVVAIVPKECKARLTSCELQNLHYLTFIWDFSELDYDSNLQ